MPPARSMPTSTRTVFLRLSELRGPLNLTSVIKCGLQQVYYNNNFKTMDRPPSYSQHTVPCPWNLNPNSLLQWSEQYPNRLGWWVGDNGDTLDYDLDERHSVISLQAMSSVCHLFEVFVRTKEMVCPHKTKIKV